MNWKNASSSDGTLPPDQVTCWICVSSPEPLDFSLRVHPGDGANESIAKPLGGVSSIFVVAAFSFSVGTASVNTWPALTSATAGLSSACAEADAATINAPPAAAMNTPKRYTCVSPFVAGSGQPSAGGARADAARNRSVMRSAVASPNPGAATKESGGN